MVESYRPSNGSEGDSFMARWCFDGCRKHTESKPCRIMGRSLFNSINDPDYPKEWVYKDGVPICTAYTTQQPPPPRCKKTGELF